LHVGQFNLLVIQTDIFPLCVCLSLNSHPPTPHPGHNLPMLERPRLTLFTLQLNQAVFSSLSLSGHQEEVNLSTKTYSFENVGRNTGRTGRTKAGTYCGIWVLPCIQTDSLTFPFKKWTFSLRSGKTGLSDVDTPCPLHLTNNKPYFLFLKTLLLFLNFW
jgi:hypothetical protein